VNQDDGVQARVPVAGFHASNHDRSNVWEVVLTEDRYVAFAARDGSAPKMDRQMFGRAISPDIGTEMAANRQHVLPSRQPLM
jgi:hypothetical protein